MVPPSPVAGLKSLTLTGAQSAEHCMIPQGNSPTQYLWDLDLGPLDPLAPIDIAADRSTTSDLVFPSMDTLATQLFDEGREVKAPQSESSHS